MIFNAFTKDANGNYTVKIENTVFPLSYSALLDERLNEAILHIYTDSVVAYEPTTEIKVVANDGTNTKDYYYIVARDISQELPNGRKRYRHELHLIERTKLLEGIYCQSLCFTNPSGNVYTNNQFNVRPTSPRKDFPFNHQFETENLPVLTSDLIKSPILINEAYTTPTPNDIYLLLDSIFPNSEYELLEEWTNAIDLNTYHTGVKVDNNGNIQSENGTTANITVNAQNPLVIEYSLLIKSRQQSQPFGYTVVYTLNAVENHYPLKPWTIKDCVNRVLDLCEPIFESEEPRYAFAPEQADKYESVRIPELTMTQCTLREALKLVGSIIHAEPRLGGYDEDGKYHENYIFFDEYGTGEESTLTGKPYIYKSYSHDINEYCTHIETSASNLVNSLNYGNGTVTEPNNNNNRTLRTDNINVMLSESNAFANTDNAIYDIPNQNGGVLVTLYDSDGTIYQDNGYTFKNIDITPYVFESHEYNNLSSYDSAYPYSKSFALYYTRGEKGIKGLFFKNENAIDQYFSNYAIVNIINAVTGQHVTGYVAEQFPRIAFKITYIPIYDTKFSHSKQTVKLGKTPFMRVYNQSENLIDSKRYGEHIKGVSQRLGNLEETRTYTLDSLNDIPIVGQMLDGYFIAEVKAEINFNSIKCTVQLSKDFNRISQYVGINSNKRVYEVSETNAYARDILLKNYVVVSDEEEIVNTENTIFNSLTPILQIFNPTSNTNTVNSVSARCYSKKGTTPLSKVLLPVVSSAFGNSMIFSWDYKDNYSAGEKVNKYIIGQDEEGNDVEQAWQTDVPCGDYYGRAYYYAFDLLTNPTNQGYTQANTVEQIGNQPSSEIATQLFYLLRKDSRERLSVNCELEFVTTKDNIIIGSALASSCPLVTRVKTNQRPQLAFYNGKIGKFDKKIDTSKVVKVVDGQYRMTNNGIEFDIPTGEWNFDSWALISPINTKSYQFEDEDGNISQGDVIEGGEILLARNKSKDDYKNDNQKTVETIKFQIARTIYN